MSHHVFSLPYFLAVVTGIALAALVSRSQPAPTGMKSHQREALRYFALGGAILGAFGLQIPADLGQWAAPLPEGMEARLRIGGRTVLGGVLGGWIAVEAGKRMMGYRGPTGDSFAAPLAIALACGRVGCLLGGCCQGVQGVPVPLLEVAFHASAFVWLLSAQRRGVGEGWRLAAYLSVYAVVRFTLERWRPHPPIVGTGLSYYQWLCLVLLAITGTTWWRRYRAPGQRPTK